jgi:uncharacterized protein YecT (DUF1311 family)
MRERWQRAIAVVVLGGGILALGSVPCRAASTVIHAEDLDCADPRGTAEINLCAQHSYKTADEDLAYVLNDVRDHFSVEKLKALREAQKAWTRFRDLNCEVHAFDIRGQTGWTAGLFECLERMTRERAQELRAMVDDR